VWELYNQWWLDNKFNEWQDKNPLEGTSLDGFK